MTWICLQQPWQKCWLPLRKLRTVEAEASRFAAGDTEELSIIQNNVIEANEMAEVITSAVFVQKLRLMQKMLIRF